MVVEVFWEREVKLCMCDSKVSAEVVDIKMRDRIYC